MNRDAASTPQAHRQAGIVLLSQPVELDGEKIRRSFGARHPGIGFFRARETVWQIGPVILGLMNIGNPLGPNLWEPHVKRARPLWPQVGEACSSHRAVIPIMVREDGRDQLEVARYATAFVDAVVDAYPEALAVIWDGGSVIASRADWARLGCTAMAQQPPASLWIGLHSFCYGDNNSGYLTLGLKDFAGCEIELEGPKQALADANSIIAAMINRIMAGHKFADGGKVEFGSLELTVFERKSLRFGALPVYSIVLPGTGTAGLSKFPLIQKHIADSDPVLLLLKSVELFDFFDERNHALLPSYYEGDERLETFDEGLADVLSRARESANFEEYASSVRQALTNGGLKEARIVAKPIADYVAELQDSMREALIKGDLLMFLPKLPPDLAS